LLQDHITELGRSPTEPRYGHRQSNPEPKRCTAGLFPGGGERRVGDRAGRAVDHWTTEHRMEIDNGRQGTLDDWVVGNSTTVTNRRARKRTRLQMHNVRIRDFHFEGGSCMGDPDIMLSDCRISGRASERPHDSCIVSLIH
jgi:hypothetical protein